MLKTAQKIWLAKAACRPLVFLRRIVGKTPEVTVTRGRIRWKLNLEEGIDFSIYALGGFEPSTLRTYERLVKPGDVVLDIGANIGAHTLPLARIVGQNGHVIAFEPTDFAIGKLRANVALNPNLAPRIVDCQYMLIGDANDSLEPKIYSSWPLAGADDVHEKHKGRLMTTVGARAVTLDDALAEMRVIKVNFLKIDVDGHEYAVLRGASGTLKRDRPTILMELAPYLFADNPADFEAMVGMFRDLDYHLTDAASGEPLPRESEGLRRVVPDGAGRNIVARVM